MPSQPEIKEWADELQRLLQGAVVAALSGNMAQIVAAQRALQRFKDESPNYADALDTQASLAIFDLDLGVAAQAAARIKKRVDEVYRLSKLITGITDEANASAAMFSGTLVKGAIDSATAAIEAFKRLRDAFSADGAKPDEKAVAADIDKFLGAIQDFRNRLETA